MRGVFVIAVEDDDFLADAEIGESISVSGVCLTATHLQARTFAVDAVEETMRRTSSGAKASARASI